MEIKWGPVLDDDLVFEFFKEEDGIGFFINRETDRVLVLGEFEFYKYHCAYLESILDKGIHLSINGDYHAVHPFNPNMYPKSMVLEQWVYKDGDWHKTDWKRGDK